MIQPPQLRIPGPTPVPDRVQRAMAAPMINHRGPEFRALLPELEAGLRWAFQTENDMLIFPASGTGGLESAVANVVSPGERVLAVTIGAFGDRFADLAEAFGANVARLTLPWGEAADPEDLDALLSREPEIATVLITHNETSTGVTNPLRSLAEVVKRHNRLLVVDGVSSIGSIDLPVDRWRARLAPAREFARGRVADGHGSLFSRRPDRREVRGGLQDLAGARPGCRRGAGQTIRQDFPHRSPRRGVRTGRRCHRRSAGERSGGAGAPRHPGRGPYRRAPRPAVRRAQPRRLSPVPRVLVADPIAEAGIARLREHAEVDVQLKQSL